ncbi:MFS transporter, DHA1 family, inner membrane transport protein [Nonomuraea solani]|uniref:MFS transporter, DHA1 family, inner membrane transport protein n=1 Tax=Nonomuraea solani TaxID=1144553 RepID=A0A1H6F526_9ACTN|nr:MFS transporter [Nonomuraea solani]SEH04094.1 MFS transporter, DHA1 family, inner membrane transport protein [Nonomuraea solani]
MRKMPLAIWAMVLGAFAMGADEFIVAGVVREIADALEVSIGAVGHLESVYALGVAIGAPVFTALGTRFGRRPMLLLTTGVFLLGNLISALGPGYEVIMTGRIVSAMAHGAFLGIAAVFAAELVDRARKGRAVAVVFSGLTASTILGAPIGAAVGQAFGWRFTFWTLVIFGGLALLGLLAALPRVAAPRTVQHEHHDHQEHHHAPAGAEFEGLDAHALAHLGGGGQGPSMREQMAALKRPAVWGALLTTMLGYGGVFTSYVYIAPQLTEITGFSPAWVTPLLLLFGVGLFAGNTLGGRLADKEIMPAVLGTLGALAIALFAMNVAIESKVATVAMMLLFGTAAFAVVAPLQLRVMAAAGHAPDVASAANISAFTLGSAIGIYLGGAAIDGGLGLSSVNWVGGLLTSAGLVAALITWAAIDRRQPVPAHHHDPEPVAHRH